MLFPASSGAQAGAPAHHCLSLFELDKVGLPAFSEDGSKAYNLQSYNFKKSKGLYINGPINNRTYAKRISKRDEILALLNHKGWSSPHRVGKIVLNTSQIVSYYKEHEYQRNRLLKHTL